jgi:hypothetical protein
MIGGDVERFEVVKVVFDLGAGGNFEAGLSEQLLDAQPHLGDRVQSATRFTATRQRDVDALLRELGCDMSLLELDALFLDERLDLFARAVKTRASFLALIGCELAQFLELFGQPATLAKGADADLFQPAHIGRARNRAESFLPARVEILRVPGSHGRA